jgi:hypothetical protein
VWCRALLRYAGEVQGFDYLSVLITIQQYYPYQSSPYPRLMITWYQTTKVPPPTKISGAGIRKRGEEITLANLVECIASIEEIGDQCAA